MGRVMRPRGAPGGFSERGAERRLVRLRHVALVAVALWPLRIILDLAQALQFRRPLRRLARARRVLHAELRGDDALTHWSKYSDTPPVPATTTPAPLLHSWEWEVVFASGDQYGAVNVGETVFNAMFNRNPMRIIKRLCAGCQGVAQKEMYYRRYTNTSDFSVYWSMLEVWSETNNVLGVDFDIFSFLMVTNPL